MTKAELLENYTNNVMKVRELTDRIDKINSELAELDSLIDHLESIDAPAEEIEAASVGYNLRTKQRIELELEKNSLEREMLQFEYQAITAE